MANNNKDNNEQILDGSSDSASKPSGSSGKPKVYAIQTFFGLTDSANPMGSRGMFDPLWGSHLKEVMAEDHEKMVLEGQANYIKAKAKGKRKERPAPPLDPCSLEPGDEVLVSLDSLKVAMCDAGIHPNDRTIAFCAQALRKGYESPERLARAYKAFLQS